MAKTPDDRRLELLQGTLDMLILRTLQWGPQHGHGIGQAIRAQSDDLLKVETGSLYPALHRLEKRGWLKSRVGRERGQPAREVLPADRRGKGPAVARAGSLVAAGARDRPHHEPGAGGEGVARAAGRARPRRRDPRPPGPQREGADRARRGSRGRSPGRAAGIRLRPGHPRLDAARLVQPLVRRGSRPSGRTCASACARSCAPRAWPPPWW